MSSWLGGNQGDSQYSWFNDNTFREYRKETDLSDPGPSGTWVLVDEHPSSINDGFFCVVMPGYPNLATTTMPDVPASYHNNACGFSFADGHSEIHKWQDKRTMPLVKQGAPLPSPNQSNNKDIFWLQDHTSRKK